MAKNIQFIFNPSELGAGTRGASLGPEAIRAAARTQQKSIFKDYKVVSVPNQNELLDSPTPYKFAKYIDGLLSVFENLAVEIHSCSTRGVFPIIVSGDHSAAAGTLKALQKENPNKRIGVVWIDAHADLHTPFSSPSGNVHGMPLAAALGHDNADQKINNVSHETIADWQQMKNMGSVSPILKPEHLIYFGVRDTEAQEDAIIERCGIRNYGVHEMRHRSFEICIAEALEQLSEVDMIYITFDVDALDCDLISHGTGTPVSKGFDVDEVVRIIKGIQTTEKVVALEVCEINPLLDHKGNRMAEAAFEVLETLFL